MASSVSRELVREGGVWAHVRGHTNTLVPFFARSLRPPALPRTQPFERTLEDPDVGPVTLTGRYLPGAAGSRLSGQAVLGVHGLGGSVLSGYMGSLLVACAAVGRPCLLLNVRGADRSGQDISHAGLTADVKAAVEALELAEAESIDLFGYSLGGQLVLKYAAEEPAARVRRVAAIGSPLLLDVSSMAFDRPGVRIYRRHVLDSLKQIYTAAYQRNPRGIVPHVARRIEYIREWDERVVAPRFGFESALDYYSKVSAGLTLDRLQRDAIYVGAAFDPMVPPEAAMPAFPAERLSVFWDQKAGHLGYGPSFDLGFSGPLGLEAQVLAWLSDGARPDGR